MSLVEVKTAEMVKKLYLFKLKTLSGAFISLIVLQMIGILISFSGFQSSGFSSDYLSVQSKHFSANIVIIFTLMWGLISSILITTKAYRYDDFSFVTNRITSHFANILFLSTTSLAGGIGAVLSGFMIKDIIFYSTNAQFDMSSSLGFSHFLISLFMTILYI